MTGKHRPARFAFSAAANWVAFLFTALVGFFLSPYLVSNLGATQYGVWSLIAGLVGYLGILDLGIRQAVNRFVAHDRASGNHAESSLIISAALRLFSFLGFVSILAAAILAYFAPRLFNIPEALIGQAQAIIVLGGISVAVALIGGVFGGAVTGIERFDVQCGIEIFVTTLRTAGIVFAVSQGHGLVAMAAAQLAASILNCVIFAIAIHRLYPELRIRLRGVLSPQMRTIITFSASLTVLVAVGRIVSYSDTVVIGAFLEIELVTYYAIAGSLCLYAKEMTRSLAYVMTPRVSALTSAGARSVGSVILTVAKVATLASTPITLTFLLRGESFISLWMGPVYGPLSGEVLRILAMVVWLDAARAVVNASIVGMGKQRLVIPGVALEAAANLALSLTLVGILGIVGVALASLLPWLVASLGYIPNRLRLITGIPIRQFWLNAILLPTLACLPFGIATLAVEHYMPARNLLVFLLQVLVFLPLVPAVAWFVCFNPDEKELAKRVLRESWLRR